MDETIKNRITNDRSNFTIEYAEKLLERAKLLIDSYKPKNDIQKFVLLKTLSMDIAFACELLIEARVVNYNQSSNHSLKDLYSQLSQDDKRIVENEVNINVLNDDDTNFTYIKRYTYERNTGIPDYNFLCDFANSLLKINGRKNYYDLKGIDTLSKSFNPAQFNFENLIEEQSNLIYEKSSLLNLDNITDESEEYIVHNIKSNDYALFSELRFKRFDKNQNPAPSHEFSSLKPRLSQACNFLIEKNEYMERYMSTTDDIDFVWTFDSLMFNENFKSGDTGAEIYGSHSIANNNRRNIYNDLNETFEKSRYCTSSFFDKYYSAENFAKRVKTITDLLISDEAKANRIIEKKNILLEKVGYDYLLNWGLTATEMDSLDIQYVLDICANSTNIIDKKIVLEKDPAVKEKIRFFTANYPDLRVPKYLDYIISSDNGKLTIDKEKLEAALLLSSKFVPVSIDNIDKCIELKKVIDVDDMIAYFINYNIDNNSAVKRYNEVKELISSYDDNEVKEFLNRYGAELLEKNDIELNDKVIELYSFFTGEGVNKYSLSLNKLITISKYPLYESISRYNACKMLDMQDMFFNNPLIVCEMSLPVFKRQMSDIYKNLDMMKYYINNSDIELLLTDINDLCSFMNGCKEKYFIDLKAFNDPATRKVYDLLKDSNLLFISNYHDSYSILKNYAANYDSFKEVIGHEIFKNINNYPEEDKDAISDFLAMSFNNNGNNKLLLSMLNLQVVKDHPRSLLVCNPFESANVDLYRINIFNTWYQKISNNELQSEGNKIELTEEQRENIIDILLEKDPLNGNFDLVNRLEKIFTNRQLVYSLDNKILNQYPIDFMNDIISKSKFKYNSFNDYNFFGNLFETIYRYDLDPTKMVSVLNKLYNQRNNTKVSNFIKDLCSSKNVLNRGFSDGQITLGFDDSMLDYLNTKLSTMNGKDLNNYMDEVIIEKIGGFEQNTPSIEEAKTFGASVLDSIRDFATGVYNKARKNVVLTTTMLYLDRISKKFSNGEKKNGNKR